MNASGVAPCASYRPPRSRRPRRGCGLLPLFLAVSTCTAPVSPSATRASPPVLPEVVAAWQLSLVSGNYWLQIYGFVASTDPRERVCTPVGKLPQDGSSLTMLVQLVSDGAGWSATSPPGFGDLSLRFQPSDRASPQGQPVAGAIRGVGYDTPVDHRPSSLQVTIGGGSAPDGALRGIGATGSFLYGEITGQSVIGDETGAVSCGLLHWTLQPER